MHLKSSELVDGMMKNREDVEVSGIDSKFIKVVLTVATVFLLLVGPTYIPYLLSEVLMVEYFASIAIGGILFIVGLLMMVYLIRKKVIV